MFPLPTVKFAIGRALALTADPKQGAEGVERVEASIKAEGELVEIGLKMESISELLTIA
jgi:hypothetical protein